MANDFEPPILRDQGIQAFPGVHKKATPLEDLPPAASRRKGSEILPPQVTLFGQEGAVDAGAALPAGATIKANPPPATAIEATDPTPAAGQGAGETITSPEAKAMAPSAPVPGGAYGEIVPRGTPAGIRTSEPGIKLREDVAPPADEPPSLGAVLGAAFRQEPVLGSILSNTAASNDRYRVEQGFMPLEEIKGTKYEGQAMRFADVFNRPAFDDLKRQIDQEEEDRRTKAAAGIGGTLADLGVGLLDPTNLFPAGEVYRGVKMGSNLIRSALEVGVAAGVAGGASELPAFNRGTADGKDVAFAIGGSALLGAFLGAGGSTFARIFDLNEARAIADRLTREINAPGVDASVVNERAVAAAIEEAKAGGPGAGGGVGAERTSADVPTLEGQAVAGRAAAAVVAASDAVKLNPIVRLLQSPSAWVRKFGEMVFESTIYRAKNFAGGSSEQSVESLVKQFAIGAVWDAKQVTDKLFLASRQAGSVLTRDQFEEAIGAAMRRGDKSDVPQVQAAAEHWRAKVFDPLKDLAIEARLLPPDVSVTEAKSYFTRLWHTQKIIADPNGFKYVAGSWIRQSLEKRVADLTERRDGLVASIKQQIEDLKATPEQTRALLGSLPAQLKALEMGNPQHVVTMNRLTRARQSLASGVASGALPAAAGKDAVDRIVEEGGKAFADFNGQRNAILRRLRNLRGNIVSRTAKVEELRNRIPDVEQANIQRLRDLHVKLSNIEDEIERGSVENHEERLSKLRTDFNEILERSARAQDRLAEFQARAEAEARKLSPVAGLPETINPDKEELKRLADLRAQFERDTGRAQRNPPAPIVEGEKTKIKEIPQDLSQILADARKPVGPDPSLKMQKRPALGIIKQLGGIDPESPLAAELRHAGVNERSAPGIFKKGGLKAADNIPASDHAIFRDLPERADGYVKQDEWIQALSDEVGGSPRRTADEQRAIDDHAIQLANVEHYRDALHSLGIDPAWETDRILAHLSKMADERKTLDYLDKVPPNFDEEGGGAIPPDELTRREAVKADKARAVMEARQRLFDEAERERTKRLAFRSQQILTLELADPEAAIASLRELAEERLQAAVGVIGRADDHMAELAARMKGLDPEIAKTKIKDLEKRQQLAEDNFARKMDGYDADNNFEGYIKDATDAVHAQLTGADGGVTMPGDIVMSRAGPLNERTFHIPDAYQAPDGRRIEEFLKSGITEVGSTYARKMAADVFLARKFNDKPTLEGTIAAINTDYKKLADTISNDAGLKPEKRAAALLALDARRKEDIGLLEAGRDMLRGKYAIGENGKGYARVLSTVNAFNYMRALGGQTLSSLTDIARPIMVHGLGRFMLAGIGPLMHGLKAIHLSSRETKLAGAVENAALARLASIGEIMDPFSNRSPFEKFVSNSAKIFSKLTGITYWTDFVKDVSGMISQDRMLGNLERVAAGGQLKSREAAYMNMLGLGADRSVASEIARQFAKHGETAGGVRVPNTERWDTTPAARAALMAYRAAVAMDVDSIVVTRGLGDIPLFAHTPIGRALLQFQSFTLATHQRMLIRGLQEEPLGVLSGFATSAAIGMLIYWMKSIEANRGEDLSDNPGRWLAEGIDRSGMFSLFFSVNNSVEKHLGLGAYAALEAPFKGSKQQPASRYINRGVAASFTGPTGDFADTLYAVVAAIKGRTKSDGSVDHHLTNSDLNAIRRLLPGSTLPVIRSIMDYYVMPKTRELAGNKPK